MRPYSPETNKGRHLAGHDVHHKTADQPKTFANASAKKLKKAARQEGYKVVRGEMADELSASVEQAQADALDAARYRFLRDTCWSSDKELATVISLQMNKVWDEKIDEAMARNKKE